MTQAGDDFATELARSSLQLTELFVRLDDDCKDAESPLRVFQFVAKCPSLVRLSLNAYHVPQRNETSERIRELALHLPHLEECNLWVYVQPRAIVAPRVTKLACESCPLFRAQLPHLVDLNLCSPCSRDDLIELLRHGGNLTELAIDFYTSTQATCNALGRLLETAPKLSVLQFSAHHNAIGPNAASREFVAPQRVMNLVFEDTLIVDVGVLLQSVRWPLLRELEIDAEEVRREVLDGLCRGVNPANMPSLKQLALWLPEYRWNPFGRDDMFAPLPRKKRKRAARWQLDKLRVHTRGSLSAPELKELLARAESIGEFTLMVEPLNCAANDKLCACVAESPALLQSCVTLRRPCEPRVRALLEKRPRCVLHVYGWQPPCDCDQKRRFASEEKKRASPAASAATTAPLAAPAAPAASAAPAAVAVQAPSRRRCSRLTSVLNAFGSLRNLRLLCCRTRK